MPSGRRPRRRHPFDNDRRSSLRDGLRRHFRRTRGAQSLTDSDRPVAPRAAQAPDETDGSAIPSKGSLAAAKAGAAANAPGGTDWWGEVKAIFWLILAVLAFHSFIAKPFYIPSESMMPTLLKGDRLVVSKYPYGWSWVSPTIPNPFAIFRSVVLRSGESWGITLPFMSG